QNQISASSHLAMGAGATSAPFTQSTPAGVPRAGRGLVVVSTILAACLLSGAGFFAVTRYTASRHTPPGDPASAGSNDGENRVRGSVPGASADPAAQPGQQASAQPGLQPGTPSLALAPLDAGPAIATNPAVLPLQPTPGAALSGVRQK